MSDHRPPPNSSPNHPDSPEVTFSAMAAVAAAIHDFGPEVLTRAPDADADHDAEIGRHILQAVDTALGQPDSLHDSVDRLAADPRDQDALADLEHAVDSATTAFPSLLAKVERASSSDDPVAEDSGVPPRSVPAE